MDPGKFQKNILNQKRAIKYPFEISQQEFLSTLKTVYARESVHKYELTFLRKHYLNLWPKAMGYGLQAIGKSELTIRNHPDTE